MGIVKTRKNKGSQDPKVEVSKSGAAPVLLGPNGYAKVKGLSNVSVRTSNPKQMTVNQSTMGAPASAKSEMIGTSSVKSEMIAPSTPSTQMVSPRTSSNAKTVSRSSVQTPTHPVKAKSSPAPSNISRPRPGPKSRTRMGNNKTTNEVDVPVTPAVKEEEVEYKDLKYNLDTNLSYQSDSEDIMIVEEERAPEYSESDNEALSQIMKQVEDLENSFKADLERKNRELENERKTVQQLKIKNKNLDSTLAELNEDVASLREDLTKENEDKSKQIEAFKSSNEGMMDKIMKLNEDNYDIDEKYKNLQLEMEAIKEKKDSEIKKEKDSLKAVLLKNVSNENTLKQTIKMFEKIVKEKGEDLQKEYELVDQLKKKNEVLENLEKKGKLLLKKKESEIESQKTQSKKNTDIFAKKLKQKQEELEKLSETSSEIICKKDEELNEANKMLDKVTKDLEKMEEWKVTEVEREKKSLISMIQKNLEESAVHKRKIEDLEKEVKDKDEMLLRKDQKIESLDKKIVEKDKLFKDLKVKVSKLITEFTKGLKEKGEQLSSKNQDNIVAHSKIKLLENKLSKSEHEKKESMKTLSQFKTIIVNLSSKITKIKSEQKNEATIRALTEKRLQNNIIKLQKRSNKNSETVKKLRNELCLKQNVDTANDNIAENVDKISMLTYLWPIVTSESGKPRNVLIALPLLKSLDPVIVINIFIPPKPVLMLTYLWPVVQVTNIQNYVQKLSISNKRKLVDISSAPPSKRICLSYNGPQLKLFKSIESILETKNSSSHLEMIRTENPSQTLKLTYLWPVAKYEPLVNLPQNDEVVNETSVPSPNKKSVDSNQGGKRKLEEINENISNAKKMKLSQEAIEHERQQIKILQERIVRLLTTNLCNDEKVREHVNRHISSAPKSTMKISENTLSAASKITPHVVSEITPVYQCPVLIRQKPMLEYLWPLIPYTTTSIQFSSHLDQQRVEVTPTLPLMKSLKQQIPIVETYPPKPLLQITYLWPVVLYRSTSTPSTSHLNEGLVKQESLVHDNFPMLLSIEQEIKITIIYPPQQLQMITYNWPIVLAKKPNSIETDNESSTQEINVTVPLLPLVKCLTQEIAVTISCPPPPLLMITYMWPIVLAKRTLTPSIETPNKEINETAPLIPLMKGLTPEITVTVSYPPRPLLMITYMWPIVLTTRTLPSSKETDPESSTQEIAVTEPNLKPCDERKTLASVGPQLRLLRTFHQEITLIVNYPLKPLLMITYLWPVMLTDKVTNDKTGSSENSKKRKLIEQILPSPKRICTLQNRSHPEIKFPLVKTVDMIQEIVLQDSTLLPKKTPVLMLTYLWPICRKFEEIDGSSSSEVIEMATDKVKTVNIIANGPHIKEVVQSLIYNNPTTSIDATMAVVSLSSEKNSHKSETNAVPMISYLWPLVPYNGQKASLKRKRTFLTEEIGCKRLRVSEAIESKSEISSLECNLMNSIPHLMLNVEIFPTFPQTSVNSFIEAKSNQDKDKIPVQMIGYNWPVVVFKKPFQIDNENKSRGCKRKTDGQMENVAKKNNTDNFEHLFKLQIPTSILKSNPVEMIKTSVSYSTTLEKTPLAPTPLMISYNWPICVYVGKNNKQVAKTQVKIQKRKLDEDNEEVQFVKKSKIDVRAVSKRKLEETGENENVPKRIRKPVEYEKHHLQKIQENLVKMMTVKLCNSPKILEKTKKNWGE